jgi:para-aminobenzoate synthetase/4-amino-4-deoxychorismate lyase
MLRNDLGRIAEIGSVQAPKLFDIEKYSTLFQMTSLVQAKTKASITELFCGLFPSASITGAPKVRTMSIISKLEETPRDIYTGCIGYISPERKAQFNVAIRTILIDQEKNSAEYGAGGIVWDSASADEYDEILLKSLILTEQHQSFSLIETMVWTPQSGYFLLERHCQRLKESAEYFDFPFSSRALNELVVTSMMEFSSPHRVRITLDRSGTFSLEKNKLPKKGKEFKVKLADNSIDSSDKFYFHKTSHREN